jgi:hypothetical protein
MTSVTSEQIVKQDDPDFLRTEFPPIARSARTGLINGWKIYPSQMGGIMGYGYGGSSTKTKYYANMWEWGNPKMFNHFLKKYHSKFGITIKGKAMSLYSQSKKKQGPVFRMIDAAAHLDAVTFNMILNIPMKFTHLIKEKQEEVQTLITELQSRKIEGTIQLYDKFSFIIKFGLIGAMKADEVCKFLTPMGRFKVFDELRGKIYMSSGTRNETSALQLANDRLKSTGESWRVDYTSPQTLPPIFISGATGDKIGAASGWEGVIKSEVDGWMITNDCTQPMGVVEHKERQSSGNDFPTIGCKKSELVQMQMYMYMTDLPQCAWVQTKRYVNDCNIKAQKIEIIKRDETWISNIKKAMAEYITNMNTLYDSEERRREVLSAVVWSNEFDVRFKNRKKIERKPQPDDIRLHVLYIGKHAGKTYAEIMNTDKRYCNWVLKKKDMMGDLLRFQNYLKDNMKQSSGSSSRSTKRQKMSPPMAPQKKPPPPGQSFFNSLSIKF